MSPFLHPTRLEYDVVKRLKCDCYKVDCISVLKVMSQEPKTASVASTIFSAFYFAGNEKKKNQLTTQLAAIGRFNHVFLFCLFIYYLNWDQTTVLSICYLITRVGKIPLMIGHLLNDSLFSG